MTTEDSPRASHIELVNGKTVTIRGTVDATTSTLSTGGGLVQLRDVNNKPVTINPDHVVRIHESGWNE